MQPEGVNENSNSSEQLNNSQLHSTESTVSTQTNSVNIIWGKIIPTLNWITMVVSLLLVFGLDLIILISSFNLLPFWIEMLIIFGFFYIFFHRENFVERKRYGLSKSKLDPTILIIIILRNIVVILNFIPLIQILGALLGVIIIIPYLILYFILMDKRSKLLVSNV